MHLGKQGLDGIGRDRQLMSSALETWLVQFRLESSFFGLVLKETRSRAF